MEIQSESNALLTQEQIVEQLSELTPRQRAWYQVYHYSLNATDAARRAGYSGSYSVLKARGYKNAHNPKLETLVADAVRRYHMGTDEIMARLAEQARADVTNFIRIVEVGGERVAILDVAKGIEAGCGLQLKKVKQKRIETRQIKHGAEGDVEIVTVQIETQAELHNPRPALEAMLRASGAMKEGVDLPTHNLNQFFTHVRNNIIGRP